MLAVPTVSIALMPTPAHPALPISTSIREFVIMSVHVVHTLISLFILAQHAQKDALIASMAPTAARATIGTILTPC